jgi:hypothetical protein
MWEFTAHRFVGPTRWTWARVGHDGRTTQQSTTAFPTCASALENAAGHGFHAGEDPYTLIDSRQIAARG